jgi:hypothetical protein
LIWPRYVTVKQPMHEPVPLSGFTTFTVLAPVVAPEEIVMLAVSVLELTKVVEWTVIPGPNLALAPPRKFEPRMSTEMLAPLAPWLGEVEVGAGAAWIWRHPVHVADCPLDVTDTLRFPTGAVAVAFTLIVSWLLLTKVVEATVTPVPETEAVAPDWKFVPFTVRFRVPPWPTVFGLIDEMVGSPAPAVTVRMPVPVLF